MDEKPGRSNADDIELKAAAAVQARKDQEKENDKNELLKALGVLASRTNQDWTLFQSTGWPRVETVKYTYPQIIEFALSGKADDKVACIARLHQEGKLKQAIEDLRTANKLTKIPAKLIQDVLDTSERMTASATSTGSASSLVAPHSAFHRAAQAGNKCNLQGTLGLSLGLLAAGGLLTAIGLMSGIATISALSAGATTPFPPLSIALLAIGGAALVTALILLAVYSYQNAEKDNRLDMFTSSASALFGG